MPLHIPGRIIKIRGTTRLEALASSYAVTAATGRTYFVSD